MKRIARQFDSCFGEPCVGYWEDEKYCVAAFSDGNAIRLDIARHDLKDGIGWDDLQQVKNDCGFENMDAVEFYPRQTDVINTGNIRHLYVFGEPLPIIRRNKNA